MSLILTLGNPDQFIQLSDRRLSSKGYPVDDESNKAGSLVCANARLIFGFSGLAKVGSFKTRQWMLNALYDSGPPDHTAYKMLERFKNRASTDFKTFPWIKTLSGSEKRLSVIFSGYLDSHIPPLGACALITNYQDYITGIDHHEARDYFQSFYTYELRPLEEPFTFIERIGMWPVMCKTDEMSLRDLLKKQKPRKAIISKSVRMIRSMADRPAAKGTIGKQITVICLPRDPNNSLEVGYHTNVVTYDYHMPSQVVSISDTERCAMMDPLIKADEPDGTPVMFVPKVSPNAPCPCKSGKKYKHCHGKFNK